MRSIRLSLVIYFLLLEAAALGAASWFVYHTARQSLAAEQQTNRKLLLAQHDDQLQEAKGKLDAQLLAQARSLAMLTQSRHRQIRVDLAHLMPLGLLSAGVAPQGHTLVPVWVASGVRSNLNVQIVRALASEIPVNDELLPRDTDLVGDEYFQINTWWGGVSRSRNLGDRTLPIDQSRLSTRQVFDWAFDEIALPNNSTGRRVMLKTPITRFPNVREAPQTSNETARAASPPVVQLPPSNPERNEQYVAPWIIVQCVSETVRRDMEVSRLTAELANRIESLENESTTSLTRLRSRFFGIAVATFLATVLGGSMLVGIGLSPLRRLGEAVSRVTEKDFRLPIDGELMPHELRPIVERLRTTLGQLGRAFDREKQAVADISHELRTPVTAILATLDVVLRKPRGADEYRQALVTIRAVGGHMRQLVEKLLALARLDAGFTRVQTALADVNDIVDQSMVVIRPLAAEKDLQLDCEIPSGLVWATDADKVREMLVNLLHNAVQYNKPAGSITVRGNVEGDRLVLTVRDTGIGIAADQIPHLFERFYRADPSREEAALHAGLGLSIVRGYADLLGGTIGVTSTFGEGTTFRISLPQAESFVHEKEAA